MSWSAATWPPCRYRGPVPPPDPQVGAMGDGRRGRKRGKRGGSGKAEEGRGEPREAGSLGVVVTHGRGPKRDDKEVAPAARPPVRGRAPPSTARRGAARGRRKGRGRAQRPRGERRRRPSAAQAKDAAKAVGVAHAAVHDVAARERDAPAVAVELRRAALGRRLPPPAGRRELVAAEDEPRRVRARRRRRVPDAVRVERAHAQVAVPVLEVGHRRGEAEAAERVEELALRERADDGPREREVLGEQRRVRDAKVGRVQRARQLEAARVGQPRQVRRDAQRAPRPRAGSRRARGRRRDGNRSRA